MPGPQPDRLEAFEDRDVLCRVGGLFCGSLRHRRKGLQNRGFAACRQCIRAGGPRRPWRGSKSTAFCTLSRRFSSSIGGGERSAPRAPARRSAAAAAGAAPLGLLLRERSGREADARQRRAARRSRPRGGRARTPRPSRPCSRGACRRGRSAPATRCARSPAPTASGQRATTSARPACGPKRESSARTCSDSLSRGHLHDLGRLDRQRASLRRGDHDLLHARDAVGEHAAAARVELREHVVEEQQRRATAAARPRRAGARAARAAARPASRSSAGRGRRRRSARRRGAARGPSSRARGRRRAAPRAPRRSAARRRSRASRRRGRAPPPRAAKPGASAAIASRARSSTSCAPSLGDALRPRRERVAVGEPELHAPKRGVALRERGRVVLRQAGARGLEPAEHAVEVRAARRRARPSPPRAGRA